MASGSAPLTLGSSAESNNSFKLMRLIVDAGTEALRKRFLKIHPRNLQVVLSTPTHQCIISNLRKGNKIFQAQWDKLYPSPPKQPNINEFDISLLSVLLRNICSLSPPNSSVWAKPSLTNFSLEADITRVRIFRNERFGHIPSTRVSDSDFKTFWAEVSAPLVRLGIDQKEIDRLENEELGQEEIDRVEKLWRECESKVLAVLDAHREVLNALSDDVNDIKSQMKGTAQNEAGCQSDCILRKHLVRCDFEREIELHSQKLTEGTRTWVFDEVYAWFHDETSQNRAFVISGVAGMGKSVIAAVLCKRFAEHLGASHFFQYNNNHYNNSAILLQSIAFQLCEVMAAYKVALVETLSGSLGESLKNMNTEALFTTLLKERLTKIVDPGKRILIVLDALDEGEYHGKQEVAHLISNHFHKLPSFIRFVITTRPEKNLVYKFQNLNPLFIEACDERNLNDVKLVLLKRISSPDVVDRIAKASGGHMLYAFLLSAFCKDSSLQTLSTDGLPSGLGGFYEIYFKRLEDELKKIFEISEEKLFSFLSVLAAGRGPLPLEFVGILFGLTNKLSTKRHLNRIFNSLSSLLVIKEDRTISPFHKSLSDWLVDPVEHDYTADVESGHQILFDLCIQKFDEMKKNDVRCAIQNNGSIKYAIKYCISHMLNAPFEAEKMECFIYNHVVDVESMFACVLVDVDLTLVNINCLINHDMYRSVSKDACTKINKLFSLVKKTVFFLRDYPQTFLQMIVNEGGKELSSEARTLLQTRYNDIIYFELVEKHKADPIKARCLLSGRISGIDVSPRHDYVVCSYNEGGIELFSLATATSEWKIDDIVEVPQLPFRRLMLPHCIVFHPNQNLILPGRLDHVLTFEGTIVTAPFQVDEAYSKFTNCCFSPDGRTLVTNYDHSLVVWDTVSGGKKFHRPCGDLLSLSFTASGHFFGTTDLFNFFTVYDVKNEYALVKHERLQSTHLPELSDRLAEIVCISDENSWFISDQVYINIINHDLLCLKMGRTLLSDIVLPSNLYHGDELQLFLRRRYESCFPRVRQILNENRFQFSYDTLKYFSLDYNDILIFSFKSNALKIFDKNLLDEEALTESKKTAVYKISIKGDFVYVKENWAVGYTICNLESKVTRPCGGLLPSFFPDVGDGVIFLEENHPPQLWKCDLSECVASFDELTGVKECILVSEELIACVHESSVIFFNVFHKKVKHQIDFREPVEKVRACSMHYDVVVKIKSVPESKLWKNGKNVEGWTKDLRIYASIEKIQFAHFSPDGNRLAISGDPVSKVVIFDVISSTFLSQVCLYGSAYDCIRLQFYDNEHLVCGSSTHMLYLINVNRGEILTCLDLGDSPWPLLISRKKSILFAGCNCSDKFELIRVCLPRTV